MKYVKIIDNRKCIGCHACSVACKEENQVPLGVFRTWVKHVEKGKFPHTRRHFQVTRCNQCENPPCVRICPTAAMYQRHDGIVEFNKDYCVGCKACLQACPYDAIYIDPESHTAAKCHFCAHRVDRGLEPACVVVCPERAIIVGDADNPHSEASRLLAREQTSVRKPEQGTRPKLFYIDGEITSLEPLAATRGETWLWSDVGESAYSDGWRDGPIQRGGPYAATMTQTVYDVPHEIPWGWKVSTYLWTKSIGAGAFFVPALLITFGASISNIFASFASVLSLLFIAITTFFLVWDLKRPERFLKIVFRPQRRSWLAIGAFVLIAFSMLAGVWFLASAAQLEQFRGLSPFSRDSLQTVRAVLNIPTAVLAILTAIYSAFLFSQAEGRDLWQSPLLPLNLFLHAFIAGTAVLMLFAMLFNLDAPTAILMHVLIAGIFALLVTELVAHLATTPATVNQRAGHYIMTHGKFGRWYWIGTGALFVAFALAGSAIVSSVLLLGALAGACALAGLVLVEHAWVQAGQLVPNS